jgi:hypothetical protein
LNNSSAYDPLWLKKERGVAFRENDGITPSDWKEGAHIHFLEYSSYGERIIGSGNRVLANLL